MLVLNAKFLLGKVLVTCGCYEKVPEDERIAALVRHARGDWGNVCEEDRKANDEGLVGDRLLSSYVSKAGVPFWIITEWDRSVTTLLLPEEY